MKKEKATTPLPEIKQGQRLPKNKRGLSQREIVFIDKYLILNNATQAAIEAGYSKKTAGVKGSQLLNSIKIEKEIQRRRDMMRKPSIADAQEVMEFLTKTMNGEIKDQFGLDAPLSERLKAAVELAKRTVDLDNRLKGVSDNIVQVKIDWSRDDREE